MSTRRGFMAFTAGAVAAGTVLPIGAAKAGPATLSSGGVSRSDNPDAELLAAYARWLPWEAERKRVVALALGDPTWDARFDAYTDAWHAGMAEMMRMPARTAGGLDAKARAMRALLENHVGYEDGLIEGASPSEEFAWSLVSDMLAGRAST